MIERIILMALPMLAGALTYWIVTVENRLRALERKKRK